MTHYGNEQEGEYGSYLYYTQEFTVTNSGAPIYILGDANGDNMVDIRDVTAIQRYPAGFPAESFNEAAADIDGNGVSITDATLIRNTIYQTKPFNICRVKFRVKKSCRLDRQDFLVGEGGFEPPKHDATDLQSAPFGHSGILPYSILIGGAGGRTRTPDLLITNQLLYQLSYTSILFSSA